MAAGPVSFQDASTVAPYEAISYVWGSNKRDQPILIDGKTLLITANLLDALGQVRLPDRPRVLWTDCICINQDNDLEKGLFLRGKNHIIRELYRAGPGLMVSVDCGTIG